MATESKSGGESSSGSGDKGGKVTFQIKKWNAVAFWSWDIYTDTCAICEIHCMDLVLSTKRTRPRRLKLVSPLRLAAVAMFFTWIVFSAG